MTIKINYTAFLKYDWELLVEKHIFMIIKSRLYEKCSEFNIFAFPENNRLLEIIKAYGISDKTKIIFTPSNQYEFPAIDDLITNPADFNLYLHTKGVTLKEKKKMYIPALAWNDYMTYFNVVHHQDCLNILAQCDAVGVEFGASLSEPDKYHYSGNFWWASKRHLENIRNSHAYLEFKKYENRYLCETIVGSVPGKYVEMFNSGTDTPKTGILYFSPIMRYSFDVNKIKEFNI